MKAAQGRSPGVWMLPRAKQADPSREAAKELGRRRWQALQESVLDMRRFFRVVPGAAFLQHFASDRRHMRKPAPQPPQQQPQQQQATQPGGSGNHPDEPQTWLAPPPSWPALVAPATGALHTLPAFWDVGPHNCYKGAQAGGEGGMAHKLAELAAWAAARLGGQQGEEDRDVAGAEARGSAPPEPAWLGLVLGERDFVRWLCSSP